MILLQRILLFIISLVCFFVCGVFVSTQIDEEAHEEIKIEMNHIIHHLLPITKDTPYAILIRLIVGIMIGISGCVLIWFENRRKGNLFVLLVIMLGIAITRGYFKLEYEVPVALSGIVVLCLYLDGTEREKKSTVSTKKID